MSKLKLTKNELKRQKEGLHRFQRFLPMLTLKKQQLQFELNRLLHEIEQTQAAIEQHAVASDAWVGLFASPVKVNDFFHVKEIETTAGNVAGVDIPLFERVTFQEDECDPFTTPFWVDQGIAACQEMISLQAQFLVQQRQKEILQEELRIITQRVNLFEKVKIPQAQENIRKINIYLGDLQTAGVVRGKIAKANVQRKNEMLS